MNLENSIKDVIAKKLEDGSIEKLVEEQLEKGMSKVLSDLFGSYGAVNEVIEKQIKSVMIPYLEKYDYSEYVTKLDCVLVEILKNTSIDNKKMLENFQKLMLPEKRKTIKVSELFEIWGKYVAENVDTSDLEVYCDDGEPSYELVEIKLTVEHDNDSKRSWSIYDYATLIFECEHDEEMNFAVRLSKWEKSNKEEWDIEYKGLKDISSLRHLNDFEILLMRLNQDGTKIIIDTESESDEIQPEAEPEATFS
ncbi:MAG: phage protein [Bacillales bacterium]|jgi:hypothetical protein|nr:phage protein [Bacillales bacterium]